MVAKDNMIARKGPSFQSLSEQQNWTQLWKINVFDWHVWNWIIQIENDVSAKLFRVGNSRPTLNVQQLNDVVLNEDLLPQWVYVNQMTSELLAELLGVVERHRLVDCFVFRMFMDRPSLWIWKKQKQNYFLCLFSNI